MLQELHRAVVHMLFDKSPGIFKQGLQHLQTCLHQPHSDILIKNVVPALIEKVSPLFFPHSPLALGLAFHVGVPYVDMHVYCSSRWMTCTALFSCQDCILPGL